MNDNDTMVTEAAAADEGEAPLSDDILIDIEMIDCEGGFGSDADDDNATTSSDGSFSLVCETRMPERWATLLHQLRGNDPALTQLNLGQFYYREVTKYLPMLCEAMEVNTTVTGVQCLLDDFGEYPSQSQNLATLIAKCVNLQDLSVDWYERTSFSALLWDSIATRSSLKRLDIFLPADLEFGRGKASAIDQSAFEEYLALSTTLDSLRVRMPRRGSPPLESSVASFSDGLRRNSGLKVLEIVGHNGKNDHKTDMGDGLVPILLPTSLTLKELSIRYCRIANACVFEQFLDGNHLLEKLTIRGCDFPRTDFLQPLVRGVLRSHALKVLDLTVAEPPPRPDLFPSHRREVISEITEASGLKKSKETEASGVLLYQMLHDRSTTLKELILRNCPANVVKEVARGLHSNCRLQVLRLKYCFMSSDAAISLQKALGLNEVLETLEMSCRGGDYVAAVSRGVAVNNTLTELIFCGPDFGHSQASPISTEDIAASLRAMLEQNTMLEAFELSGHHSLCSSTVVLDISTGLMANRALKKLVLSGQHKNIPFDGMRAVKKMLEHNTTLEHFNLSHYELGSEGARVIAEGLIGNSTLKHLGLVCDSIKGDGMIALATMLQINGSLESLDLEHNPDKWGKNPESVFRMSPSTDMFHLFAASLPKMAGLKTMAIEEVPCNGHEAFLDGVKHNVTLTKISFYTRGMDKGLREQVQFYLDLNRAGRRHLLASVIIPFQRGLWARNLAKVAWDPNRVFYFLENLAVFLQVGT